MELISLVQQLIYVLPLLTVIYLLGKVMAEFQRVKEDVNTLKDADKEIYNKVEDHKSAFETSLSTIMTQLSNINVSIARLETIININKINKDKPK